MTATILGARLRARMAELGVNQTEAAEMCGVSRTVFAYWVSERGTMPALETVDSVAAFLAVDRDDVLAMYPATYGARRHKRELTAATTAEVAELREVVQALTAKVELLTEIVRGRMQAQ